MKQCYGIVHLSDKTTNSFCLFHFFSSFFSISSLTPLFLGNFGANFQLLMDFNLPVWRVVYPMLGSFAFIFLSLRNVPIIDGCKLNRRTDRRTRSSFVGLRLDCSHPFFVHKLSFGPLLTIITLPLIHCPVPVRVCGLILSFTC